MMLNIDLTNRCNLHCPICFANSDASGYLYELDFEQARSLIASVAADKPRPACLQFSGGEPTLHPVFIRLLREAKKGGFSQLQAASNGLRFAREPDFARAASDAGLNVIYLQFDGVTEEVYQRTRSRPLLDLKMKALENIYNAGMRTCLVPTIVKGFNDDQIGAITRFAVDNSMQIIGISWQPVSFTGRCTRSERNNQRFTLADLAHATQDQTGSIIRCEDWFPYRAVEPFCHLAEAIFREPTLHTSCHDHCGMATYLVVNSKTRAFTALPQTVEIEGLMHDIAILASNIKRQPWRANRYLMTMSFRKLRKYFHEERSIPGWDFETFADFLSSFVTFSNRYPDNTARRHELETEKVHSLLITAMHFQDVYNFELDRIRRCVIHQAAPDGKRYPFCTYNAGPFFRSKVETSFARQPEPQAAQS